MSDVRVCEELFPEGYAGKPGFPMNVVLKNNLDVLLKNFQDDWDFTIIISGRGEVRVGKSVLASQIAVYVADTMFRKYKRKTIFNLNRNVVFEGEELISKGHWLGEYARYSPLLFDEAGADLESKKVLTASTKKVTDYYRECGQYNLFNILVLPEYFDLPKGIAVSRSIFLLDVGYISNDSGKFIRGYFNFYSRRKKKKLYIFGRRDLNYNAVSYDFSGRFAKFYPYDEAEYRRLKQKALLARKETDEKKDKKLQQRDAILYIYKRDMNVITEEIREKLEAVGINMGIATINQAISRFISKELKEKTDNEDE